MLGIDPRAIRVAWSVFLFALVLGLIYLIAHTLLLFIFAILFAYLLSPVVDYCQRLMRRFLQRPSARILSLAAVYVMLVGVLVVAGILIGGKISDQLSTLADQAPGYVKALQAKLATPGPPWFEPIRKFLESEISTRAQNIAGMAEPVLKKVAGSALSVASNLVWLVLIPILGFFFLKDGSDMKEMWVDQLFCKERRPVVENILADVHALLGQFMRALVLLALATFTVYSIFLSIVGVPYSILLALTAALLEFIPVVGTASAAVLIILVAAFSHGGSVLAVIIFLGAYRIFQDYVLSPHLMSQGVELHPLAVIFGVLAGEQVAGVAGMFLSIPVMAILRVIYLRMQRARIAAAPTVVP